MSYMGNRKSTGDKHQGRVNLNITSSREILAIFMKGNRHHTICRVKGLLHAITVVNVYVDIKDSIVVPKRDTLILVKCQHSVDKYFKSSKMARTMSLT